MEYKTSSNIDWHSYKNKLEKERRIKLLREEKIKAIKKDRLITCIAITFVIVWVVPVIALMLKTVFDII